MKKPKVAFVHDYLTQYGGAEKVLEAFIELFPEAPIYTGIYNKNALAISKIISNQRIITAEKTLINAFPKYFTFLMPLIFEGFDLREYDIIISDGTAWAKGIITKPNQIHISYIHTPPRFLYKYSVESQARNKWYFKPAISIIDHFLRIWDYAAAQRPDYILTNSEETKRRIRKFYRKDATVIYPPVDIQKVDLNKARLNNLKAPYYLLLGRIVPYKNFDLIIEAFNLLGLPLVIMGTGPEEAHLKAIAKENITFMGQVSDEIKMQGLTECLGVISSVVDEDFGIVPIEAMSFGKPVLAHKSGGVLETVKDGINGVFYETQEVDSLIKSIRDFDDAIRHNKFSPEQIKKSIAYLNNKEAFKTKVNNFVVEKWKTLHANS